MEKCRHLGVKTGEQSCAFCASGVVGQMVHRDGTVHITLRKSANCKVQSRLALQNYKGGGFLSWEAEISHPPATRIHAVRVSGEGCAAGGIDVEDTAFYRTLAKTRTWK